MSFGFVLSLIVLALGGLAALVVPKRVAREVIPAPTERSYSDSRRFYGEETETKDKEKLTGVERERRSLARRLRVGILGGTAVLFGLLTLWASFGRAIDTLDAGPQFIAPWDKVEKFDASTKTLVLRGKREGDKDDPDGPGVPVRLANQTTATVDVDRQSWNVVPAKDGGDVIELYGRYKAFDNIEPNLIKGEMSNALLRTMAGFDPLAVVNSGPSDTVKVKSVDQLAEEARTAMQSSIDALVGPGSVKVEKPLINLIYDDTTQGKLNSYAQALADTRIAQQTRATAEQRALANKALTVDPKTGKPLETYKDPAVMYQNCLSLVDTLGTRGHLGQLPVGTLQCTIPGAGGSGPQTSVLVGQRAAQ